MRVHPDVAGGLEGEREAMAAALGSGATASGSLEIQGDPSLRHDQDDVEGG